MRVRRPLGYVIKKLVFGLICTTALVFAAGMETQREINAHFSEVSRSIRAFERQATELLTAMLNQEVGLRAYLATGEHSFLEPFELGERQERKGEAALRVAGEAIGDPALPAALNEVMAASDRWHRDIAGPQLRARGEGPLLDLPGKLGDGKGAFDTYREVHARLVETAERRAAAADAARSALVFRIQVSMVAAAAFVWVLATVVALRLIRRLAVPMVELVRRADLAEGFVEPSEREVIHEVYALGHALHRLDAQVRKRSAELADAHDAALAMTRFGEFVQQLASEEELYQGLDRVCRSLVEPSQINILVRNASRNRLHITHSTIERNPHVRLPILSDPMKCRAVRTLREVRSNSGCATACDCTLGVPERGSMVCVPMLAAGELVGVVNLHSENTDHFQDRAAHALLS